MSSTPLLNRNDSCSCWAASVASAPAVRATIRPARLVRLLLIASSLGAHGLSPTEKPFYCAPQLAPVVDVGDDIAFGAEADPIPLNLWRSGDSHHERGFAAGHEGRRLNRRAAGRDIAPVAIEEQHDGAQVVQLSAAGWIPQHPSYRQPVRVAFVSERHELER